MTRASEPGRWTAPRRAAVVVWLLAMLAGLVVVARLHLRTDLSAFMPTRPTARQQLLIDQLREGIVARMVMVGIAGGDAASRARLSEALAERLRGQADFVAVQNGDAATRDRDRAYFFDNRYLLSPDVDARRFEVAGLHAALSRNLDALAGSGGLALEALFPRDPTGETLAVLRQFAGASQPPVADGVWASRDGSRAILLLETRADGADLDAQARALGAVRAAFAAIPGRPADARLLLGGTGVASLAARAAIEHEVTRLAGAGTALVVLLLLVVYRSPRMLALGLLPVVSGALAGVVAVALGFGYVHGLTLGFGTTLIGEAVDYSIYLFVQGGDRAGPGFWRTIGLGVATSLAGFAALTLSGFPGLQQLGVYSIAGLLAAALVTRFVLPALLPARVALPKLDRLGGALDAACGAARRLRLAALLLGAAAVVFVATQRHALWNRELGALSPVPAAEQRIDAELRSDLGEPDLRYLASFTAPDAESALRGAERVGAVLHGLVADGTLAGFTSPALALPSVATQRRRQAALPDAAEARRRLEAATRGLPVRAAALSGFVDDLEAARHRAPLMRADLQGSSAAMLVDSLLVRRAHDVLVLLPLRPAHPDALDVGRVAAALGAAGLPQVTVIDLLAETRGVFDHYLAEAATMAALGSLAVVLLLAGALRRPARTIAVVAPLALAVACVTAGLLLAGQRLTILHLVGLMLVVAIGSNYALFFDSAGTAPTAPRRRTLVSLLVANLATVGSFGLLATSTVPVLSAIGSAVAPGTLLALLFSAALSRPPGIDGPGADASAPGARSGGERADAAPDTGAGPGGRP